MRAHCCKVSKIPAIESSFIVSRKHELIWGLGVPIGQRVYRVLLRETLPALKRVGVACVKYFWLISL